MNWCKCLEREDGSCGRDNSRDSEREGDTRKGSCDGGVGTREVDESLLYDKRDRLREGGSLSDCMLVECEGAGIDMAVVSVSLISSRWSFDASAAPCCCCCGV